MNKELRKMLKSIRKDGFTIIDGKSHIKIYTPEGKLFYVMPHGNNRDRVPGGSDKEIRKALKRWEEGWA